MFERFTERARKVVMLAQDEARHFNHDFIGTEHILLGLVKEEGAAARTLASLGVTLDAVRKQVVEIVGYGEPSPSSQAPFTPRSKHVLELALREALQLGHNYVGTEHLLLGLVRQNDGVAARILSNLGLDADGVRRALITMFGRDAVHSSYANAKPRLAPTEPRSLAPRTQGSSQGYGQEQEATTVSNMPQPRSYVLGPLAVHVRRRAKGWTTLELSVGYQLSLDIRPPAVRWRFSRYLPFVRDGFRGKRAA
jgi:ATP-dependent Clp protease ATP-binding subunit ClpA